MQRAEGGATFAEEILVTKTDLEEKVAHMKDLKNKVDELTLHNDYQLRLKDMNYNAKIKDVTEKFKVELDQDKKKYGELEQDKRDMERNQLRAERERKALKMSLDKTEQEKAEAEEELSRIQDEKEEYNRSLGSKEVECVELKEELGSLEQKLADAEEEYSNKLMSLSLTTREEVEHERERAKNAALQSERTHAAKVRALIQKTRSLEEQVKGLKDQLTTEVQSKHAFISRTAQNNDEIKSIRAQLSDSLAEVSRNGDASVLARETTKLDDTLDLQHSQEVSISAPNAIVSSTPLYRRTKSSSSQRNSFS